MFRLWRISCVTGSFHNHCMSSLQPATTWQATRCSWDSFPGCGSRILSRTLFHPDEDCTENSWKPTLLSSRRNLVCASSSILLGSASVSLDPAPRNTLRSFSISFRGVRRRRTLRCCSVVDGSPLWASGCGEGSPAVSRLEPLASLRISTMILTDWTRFSRMTALHDARSSAQAFWAYVSWKSKIIGQC